MTVGEKIYTLRVKQNLSQKAFAEKIGASQASVNYWESGKRQPKLGQLQKIADFFEITLDSLLSSSNTVQKQDPLNMMFGSFYGKDCADIHFTTDEYSLDELEQIQQFAEFLKSKRTN